MFGQVVYSLHCCVSTVVTCDEDFTQIYVKGQGIPQTKIGLSQGKWRLWIGKGPGSGPIIRSEKFAAA